MPINGLQGQYDRVIVGRDVEWYNWLHCVLERARVKLWQDLKL